MAPDYTLKGIEHEIRCPTFVCNTDADNLGVNAPTLFRALTCPGKKYVQFRAAEGAGEHCESGARTALHQQAFDWLDEILAPDHPRQDPPATCDFERAAARPSLGWGAAGRSGSCSPL
jgi:hypothetical protein